MKDLFALAERCGARLKARGESIAVAESSSGGLVSAALLSMPGASGFFLGGAVVYTSTARQRLLDLPPEAVAGMRSASEPYAQLLARTVRERFSAIWGLSESGAAGPTGNPYGDQPGHSCIAISGRAERVITVETGSPDRAANMQAFAKVAIALLLNELG